MARTLIERRKSPRYLCSHIVEIWHGRETTAGLLEDLSAEGAAIAFEAPLERDELVVLVAGGLQAGARVRYCTRRENDYRLGLEFTSGSRWQPHQWRPDHLFLPPSNK
jgi:hypothetical protein